MNYNKIIIGSSNTTADALKKHILTLDLSLSYAQMMLNRVNGIYKDQCVDTYYIAQDNGEMFSRLWNGWGKHTNAVGNFGNFLTLEKARGMGLGRELLSMWNKDISEREDIPLALFLQCGKQGTCFVIFKIRF